MLHAKHTECHHECKVLKMEIPGLCDICNEQIGDFEFLRDYAYSNVTKEVIIWSHANSSVSLYFDSQQCSTNEVNVTLLSLQSQYR